MSRRGPGVASLVPVLRFYGLCDALCVCCSLQNADGVMDRVGAARFIDSCCHDNCKPTDERVSKFFRLGETKTKTKRLSHP